MDGGKRLRGTSDDAAPHSSRGSLQQTRQHERRSRKTFANRVLSRTNVNVDANADASHAYAAYAATTNADASNADDANDAAYAAHANDAASQ